MSQVTWFGRQVSPVAINWVKQRLVLQEFCSLAINSANSLTNLKYEQPLNRRVREPIVYNIIGSYCSKHATFWSWQISIYDHSMLKQIFYGNSIPNQKIQQIKTKKKKSQDSALVSGIPACLKSERFRTLQFTVYLN